MTAVLWQDPPESTRGRAGSIRLAEIARELRANPGRWALVWESNTGGSVGTRVRNGTYASFRSPEEFEVRTVRSAGTGRTDVYVRFIGSEAAS